MTTLADADGATRQEATAVADRRRDRLSFDLDVDVCVIGGGLAGLTIARETARRGWSVALLETQRIGWSASSRNTGLVVPGFDQSIDGIAARVGIAHARELWTLSERGVDYVRRTIAETAMRGTDPVPGHLSVETAERGEDARAAVDLLREEMGATVEDWPRERVRAVLRSDRYFDALHYPGAFHIHPVNYARGLAAAAEAAGARLFEETAALAIDPAGVRKRVSTPGARVRAAHVVLAGNAHLGALMSRVATTLIPVTRTVITTAPIGARLDEAIAFRGSVAHAGADTRYRIVEGDRLQWSGGTRTWAAEPRSIARRLQREIARVYPQLGPVELDEAWSGTFGVPVHGMPQIGELAPGLWLASGFGGHGINTTAMAGELIAAAITDNDQTWRLFLPFELVWAGGVMGRAVLQGLMWFDRAGQAIAARRARRRDARRGAAKRAAAARWPDVTASAAKEPAVSPVSGPEGPESARKPAAPNPHARKEPVLEGAEPPLQDDDRPRASRSAGA